MRSRRLPVFATIGHVRLDLSLTQLIRGRYVLQSGVLQDVEIAVHLWGADFRVGSLEPARLDARAVYDAPTRRAEVSSADRTRHGRLHYP